MADNIDTDEVAYLDTGSMQIQLFLCLKCIFFGSFSTWAQPVWLNYKVSNLQEQGLPN